MKTMLMLKAVFTAVSLLLLFGCGGVGIKNDLDVTAAPELIDTSGYLPVQEYDEKTASFLPYEPQENPYLALEGRINKDAVTKFIDARRSYRQKEYDDVESLLAEIVVIDESLSGPWVMRGDISTENHDLETAVTYYQKALEVNSKNLNAYIRLAKTQRLLGRFIQAQNTYAEALRVWEDFPEAHLNLGVLYDIYLNRPLRAQKHMEAYVFLSEDEDATVGRWLQEIQQRTGVASNLTQQRQGPEPSISAN